MGAMRTRLLAAAILLLQAHMPASATMTEKTGTFGGLKVTYKVVLPDNYDPARAFPLVLVFTGGGQSLEAAGSTLEADWRTEGEKRGYILVSPGTPNGELFYEGADKIFPAFVDRLLQDYKVKDGKIHIAGHSNGGISAFRIATTYPKYFSTVIGYPGVVDDPDADKIPAQKPMCIFMHFGDGDPQWGSVMVDQAQDMADKGFRIEIASEKNQGHRLKAAELNLSNRLFDEIESGK